MPLTTRQRIMVVVAALIVVAGAAAFYLYSIQPRVESNLIIYGPRGISGLGEVAAKAFSQKFGVNATFIHFGMGSIEIANKVIEEKANPLGDVIFGLPEFYAKPIVDKGVLESFTPPNIAEIPRDKVWDATGHITPLDEGYIMILYNESLTKRLGLTPPATLDDLVRAEYKGLVVYNNPITSGTGLSVLTWVLTEKGEAEGFAYLARLKSNLAPPGYPTGFSSLVRVMQGGQATVVLSFTSHAVDPSTPNMKAAGKAGFLYREGMALIKGAKHPEAAKKFIEFMLSKEGQDLVDPNNFMYPVRPDALVKNLKDAPIPTSKVVYNPALGGRADEWRDRWNREIKGT